MLLLIMTRTINSAASGGNCTVKGLTQMNTAMCVWQEMEKLQAEPLSYQPLSSYDPLSAPGTEQGVDEGYTYVIEPSPDWLLCLLQKSSVDTMVLKLVSTGYTQWRVSE